MFVGVFEEHARALLGTNETDLPEDVRIARRGSEHSMVTEEHVIGRRTVSLDDTDGSGFRVVGVTAETGGGPMTFTLVAG